MKSNRAAHRYAKSFLYLAIEQKVLDKVYADVQLLHKTLSGSKDLVNMLSSPIVKTDKKIAILKALFQSRVDKLTLSFLELITKKKREGYLNTMCGQFIALYCQYKGILTAEVVSAHGLDKDMRAKVLKLVKTSADSEVELIESIDEELLGGFIIKVGDTQYDASVSHQLSALRKTFRENPFVK